jgi:precorrin-6Y C5,15-methyltransferase (decarboxylating)
LRDDQFSTWNNQLTKREIRLLSLAELRLAKPGEVFWDVGAGSGSLSIEAARSQPAARVFAVERRAELCRHIRANMGTWPATKSCAWLKAKRRRRCSNFPDPDAVFIGGSGGRLAEILRVAQQRLRPGGRLVINLVVLENLLAVRRLLPDATIVQVQVNRAVPIVQMVRFEPLNPVYIVTWSKVHE